MADIETKAVLGWEDSKFVAGVGSAMKRMEGLASSFRASLNKIGGVVGNAATSLPAMLGAGLSVGAGVAGVTGAYGFASEMQDMSDRTGIGVKSLVVLKTALKDAGIEFSALTPAIGAMHTALFKESEAFDALGLSVAELKEMNPGDAFMKVSEAIQKVGNVSDRVALEKKIFGRAGVQLGSFFADPNALKNAERTVGSTADVVDNNKSLDRISDILGHSEEKMRGLFIGIADGLSGVLLPLLEKLDGIDLVSKGQQMAEYIKEGAAFVVAGFDYAKDIAAGPIGKGITDAFVFVGKVISGVQAAMEIAIISLSNKFAVIYNGFATLAGIISPLAKIDKLSMVPVPAFGDLMTQYQSQGFSYGGAATLTGEGFGDKLSKARKSMGLGVPESSEERPQSRLEMAGGLLMKLGNSMAERKLFLDTVAASDSQRAEKFSADAEQMKGSSSDAWAKSLVHNSGSLVTAFNQIFGSNASVSKEAAE